MIYFCCDERRRDAVQAHPVLNGIDFLEVLDDPSMPFEQRQRLLLVHFIKDLTAGSLKKENVHIEGGERIGNIKVTNVTINAMSSPPGSQANVLIVEVSEPGDFSTYTLHLVQDNKHSEPPTGFDPVLSTIEFSFKVTCPAEFDCKQEQTCPTEPAKQPEINYLAKDYASFRQLMLDRIATLMPNWKERNPADLGIVLVELLAYVGDYLSYQQDAIATESYLGTSRRRTSVRRHTRLIDYPMHDGRNARVWIQVRVNSNGNGVELKKSVDGKTTKLLTHIEGLPKLISQDSSIFEKALVARPQIFELMHNITLFEAHNEMKFYTWGARECCLPKGAVRATLHNRLPDLKEGDVLILQEVKGPQTGEREDADPSHRHAVRLKKVLLSKDPLGGRFDIPATNNPVDITEIEWAMEDALPFPLCISARNDANFYEDVSVALGNIVLADHGMIITDEPYGRPFDPDRDTASLEPYIVPSPNAVLTKVVPITGDRCQDSPVTLTPARYRPRLKQAPLTQAVSYDPDNKSISATAVIQLSIQDPLQIPLPFISLNEFGVSEPWLPKRDLLASDPNSKEFVVEIETDGTAYLRFGDNVLGSRPAPGAQFIATYRIGNGIAGNIGADTITHLVSSDPAIISDLTDPIIDEVRNPLPGQGGIEPETIEQVRQNAPSAFRKQERAVTPHDYEEVVKRCRSDVQRAAATFRWTGSWRTVFLTMDRLGGAEVDKDFEKDVRKCMERYRMAGYDLEVDAPHYVSLEIEMVICVKSNYFTSDVKGALLEFFSNRILPDRRRGVFHPDNFTFGQTVYLSSIIAAAQSLAGVDSVEVKKFQRQGIKSDKALKSGKLELGRLEIARLDNDPDFPERGVLNLIMRGGR
ncbi:MAG: putative baseplate assembly protein [Acidobacteriota bacterium]